MLVIPSLNAQDEDQIKQPLTPEEAEAAAAGDVRPFRPEVVNPDQVNVVSGESESFGRVLTPEEAASSNIRPFEPPGAEGPSVGGAGSPPIEPPSDTSAGTPIPEEPGNNLDDRVKERMVNGHSAEAAAVENLAPDKPSKIQTGLRIAEPILLLLAGFAFQMDVRPVELFLTPNFANQLLVSSCDNNEPTSDRVCLARLNAEHFNSGECPGTVISLRDYCSRMRSSQDAFEGVTVKFSKIIPANRNQQNYALFLFHHPSDVFDAFSFWRSIFASSSQPFVNDELRKAGKVEG